MGNKSRSGASFLVREENEGGGHQHHLDKRRLLVRWRSQLGRRFGGARGHSPEAGTATPSPSLEPAAANAPERRPSQARQRLRSKSWLIKSLSSSTSALLSPLRSKANQSRSEARTTRQKGAEVGENLNKAPRGENLAGLVANKTPTSPYKRLKRRLAAATGTKGSSTLQPRQEVDRKCTTGVRLAQLLGSPRLFRRRRKRPQDDEDENKEDKSHEIRTTTASNTKQLRLVSVSGAGRSSMGLSSSPTPGEVCRAKEATTTGIRDGGQVMAPGESGATTERAAGRFYANEFVGSDLIEQLEAHLNVRAEIMGQRAPVSGALQKAENDDGRDHDGDDAELMRPLVQRRSSSSSSTTTSSSSSSSMRSLDNLSRSSSCSNESRNQVRSKVKVLSLSGDNERSVSQPVGQTQTQVQSGGTNEQQQQRQRLTRAPSSGVAALRSNFKKLVKRQQSVDSYRMARELKNKQRRQHDHGRQKHQSNEAIPTAPPVGAECAESRRQELAKLLMLEPTVVVNTNTTADVNTNEAPVMRQSKATPPSSLSLGVTPAAKVASRHHLHQPFVVGTFSGSITPTYPTHHLPGPKYQPKKFSNASTCSSLLGADLSLLNAQGNQQTLNQQTTDTSTGAPSLSPSPAALEALRLGLQGDSNEANLVLEMRSVSANTSDSQAAASLALASAQARADQDDLEAAAKRAQLAEHIYDNKCGLGDDMKFLASLPELCDITFLVGETREPVCAVKSVLAARSRVFHKILFGGQHHRHRATRQQQQQVRQQEEVQQDWDSSATNADQDFHHQRLSSACGQQATSTASRQPSPSQLVQVQETSNSNSNKKQHWSVVADASGYAALANSHQAQEQSQQHSGRNSSASQLRSSVTGGDSAPAMSQSRAPSQSSQQPLIIGPGQRATPAPKSVVQRVGANRKRDSKRFKVANGETPASRLSRMFLKRASADGAGDSGGATPNVRQAAYGQLGQPQTPDELNSGYLDKMSSSQMSTTMIIEEFEPDVFRQLIEYIHTGCVLLQARTLLGLLNAADYYGLEQLRRACLRFVSCCITVDTVCSLLSTAERYIQYKCTKSIVQKVLEFVDSHAEEIFKLNAFGLLPEHVVRLILARDGLQADEEVKYAGVYTWCEHYCRSYELADISSVMQNFLDFIHFHKISSQYLLNEIYPARVVPDNVILIALAYQADPSRFEPQPAQARRMTLPNPVCYHKNSSAGQSASQTQDPSLSPSPSALPKEATKSKRKSAASNDNEQQRQLRGRKSTGGSAQAPSSLLQALQVSHRDNTETTERTSRLRKGSIAQVSLSGMVRLSHRLSIKKRHSQAAQTQLEPSQRRRLGSSASNWVGGERGPVSIPVLSGPGKRGRHAPLGKQQSSLSNQQQDDPILLGKQILDAYLEERRRQLLAEEEEERRRLAQLEPQLEQMKKLSKVEAQMSSGAAAAAKVSPAPAQSQSQSNRRKSFRDFRNMFKRHSSSKSMLQQQHSAAPSTTTSTTTWQSQSQSSAPSPSAQSKAHKDGERDKDKDKRRSVFRRSETVFEAG